MLFTCRAWVFFMLSDAGIIIIVIITVTTMAIMITNIISNSNLHLTC